MTGPQQNVVLRITTDNKATRPIADVRAELRRIGTDTDAASKQAAGALATLDRQATTSAGKVKAGADDATKAIARIEAASSSAGSEITDTGTTADRAMQRIRSAVSTAASEFRTGFDEGSRRAAQAFDDVPNKADAALSRIPLSAETAAKKASRNIEDALRKTDMDTPLNEVASKAEPQVQASGFQVGARFGAAFTAALTAVGIGGAITDAMDWEAQNAKTAGALRLTADEVKQYGVLAGKLYTDGVSAGATEANEVLRNLTLNVGKGSTAEMERWANAASAIADAYGQDITGVTVAVGQAVRTGMAPSVDAAFDQIAAGFGAGVDRGQDYLDTINEYSVAFQSLGLDGTKMGGILAQALGGGARNSDLAADAIKEFSIRAKDASTGTATAYKALGLDAEAMTAKIAGGGEGAADGLQEIISKLSAMTDPVAKNQAAVALFGTQAEDLQRAFDAIDPGTAVDAMGQVDGAATQLGTTLYDTASSKAQTLYRTMKMTLVDFMLEHVVPVVALVVEWFRDELVPVLQRFADWLNLIVVPAVEALWSWLGDNLIPILSDVADWLEQNLIPALQDLGDWIVRNREWLEPLVVGALAAWTAFKLFSLGIALVSGAFRILTAVMAFNPIGLILLAVTALVAGLIWAYHHSERFREIVDIAWRAIGVVAKFVWDNVLQPVFVALGGAVLWVWDFFSNFGSNMQQLFIDIGLWVGDALNDLVDWFNRIPEMVSTAWSEFGDWAGGLGHDLIVWILNGIIDAANGIAEWAGNLGTQINDWVGEKWNELVGLGSDLIDWIGEGIYDAADGVWEWFKSIPDKILEAIKSVWSKVTGIGGELMTGIAEGITGSDKITAAVGANIQNGGLTTTGGAVQTGIQAGIAASPFSWIGDWFFADGGTVPGYAPRQDTVPAMLSPGEGIMVPELARQVGPTRLNTWNRQARSGVQLFADGGIAGMAHQLGVPLGGVMAGLFADKITAMGLGATAAAAPAVDDNGGGTAAASYTPSAGVAQWTSVVLQALAMVGQPASLLSTTLRRMNQESSGNPKAINLTDSNARKGTPSKGLMQVIDPTFRAYAEPGYSSDIWDPLSNILASMNYAMSRYGTLSKAYDRAGGYDSGGWLPGGGGVGINNLDTPEAVLTPAQWSIAERAIAAGTSGTQITFAPGSIVITVDGNTDPEQLAEQLAADLRTQLADLLREDRERSMYA